MRIALVMIGLLIPATVLQAAKPDLTPIPAVPGRHLQPLPDFGQPLEDGPSIVIINLTSPRTVTLLGEALKEAEGNRRLALLHDLGSTRLPEAVPYITPFLTDSDPALRVAAVRALVALGDPEQAARLAELSEDPNLDVRRQVAWAGVQLKSPSLVTAALNDPELSVAVLALDGAKSEHGAVVAGLVEKLKSTDKLAAIATLGRLGDPKYASGVLKYLTSSDPAERVAAIAALRLMKATAWVDSVQARLADPHPAVRREAVTAAAALLEGKARSIMAGQMLKDGDPTVRTAAAEALRTHPDPDQIPLLETQLSDSYDPLYFSAREALLAAGEAAIPTAVALLDRTEPRLREDGSYVLGRLKSTAGYDRHLSLLEDSNLTVVAQAAESLGLIGDPRAIEPLRKWVERSNHLPKPGEERNAMAKVCGNAMISAGRLKDMQALPLVLKFAVEQTVLGVPSSPGEMRVGAIYLFGETGSAQDTESAEAVLSNAANALNSNLMRAEAMKAIVKIGYQPALKTITEISTQDRFPELRWIAHHSREIMMKESLPMERQTIGFAASTSIKDVPPRQ